MGLVHLYTGEGGGKTTAALGVALRALGHGQKVVVVQFMKGRKDIGEYKIMKKLRNYKVRQFGRRGFVDLKNPSDADREAAQRGLEFARQALKTKPDILVLDEINIAVAFGLVKSSDVLNAVKRIPRGTTVYMTGRRAPQAFVRRADFVTRVEDVKRPGKIRARKGIEY